MYCGLDEAFNSSIEQQIKMAEETQHVEMAKHNMEQEVETFQDTNNIVAPHTNTPDMNQYNFNKMYFNPQGDIDTSSQYEGTPIKELAKPIRNRHSQHIKSFLNMIENDASVNESSLHHVRKCRKCRHRIRRRLQKNTTICADQNMTDVFSAVLIGILVIFMVHMLVKIGRRL